MKPEGFRPDVPFKQLPKLPPTTGLETSAVLKACIAARAALAELHAATELMPNPTVLINTIPILEAHASSEIENIVTTADELFRLAASDAGSADSATKEALRYRTALWRGFELLSSRPVSTNLAIEVCTTLRAIETNVRKIPGTTLRNLANGEPVYTPPDGDERLRTLLANWEAFLHEQEDLDPLVRMAVGHYQFEAIHPFEDGNGRTGRILNLLYLVEQGLLQTPVLYMSRAIIRTKSEYYQLLLEVSTQQRWEPWVLYMLRVVAETSRWTTAKIRAIRQLLKTVAERVQQKAPKIYSRELVELICEQPYCRIDTVVQAGIAKRQTASVYLAALADIGILRPIPGGREKLFLHSALMELLGSDGDGPTPGNVPPATADRPQIDVTPDVRNRSEGVNRASAIDEQLRFAIANKLLIQVSYNGSTRVMEPHDYGLLKGSQKLLAYQLRRNGGGPRKALTGWRLLDVAKIESCLVLDEAFPGSRGASHQHHYVWDFLNARVSG